MHAKSGEEKKRKKGPDVTAHSKVHFGDVLCRAVGRELRMHHNQNELEVRRLDATSSTVAEGGRREPVRFRGIPPETRLRIEVRSGQSVAASRRDDRFDLCKNVGRNHSRTVMRFFWGGEGGGRHMCRSQSLLLICRRGHETELCPIERIGSKMCAQDARAIDE